MQRVLYRAAFVVGVAAFFGAFVLGSVQSWRADGMLPELRIDALGQARAASAVGDRETALRELRAYASIDHGRDDGWMRLGNYLWKTMGDREGAIGAFEQAARMLPAPVEAHQALAILYHEDGQIEAARAHARIAQQNGAELPPDVEDVVTSPPSPDSP